MLRCEERRRILVRTAESGPVTRGSRPEPVRRRGRRRLARQPRSGGVRHRRQGRRDRGGAARDRRAHRHRQQQRGGVPRADRRPRGGPRARPDGVGRGPAGLQAHRRADVRPLEDQAPRTCASWRCGRATCCRRRTSPTSGCRASATSTPTGWPTRRSTRSARRGVVAGRQHGRAAGAGRRRRGCSGQPRARLVGWDHESGTPTTTVLLRHGETPHTAEKRFSGSGGHDPELSARGCGRPRPWPSGWRTTVSTWSCRRRCGAPGRPPTPWRAPWA